MVDNFNISRIAGALERIADKMDDLDLALSTINETLENIKNE